ncbi:copper resistance CopC/CopD family protein [Microlunatus soli]|uniref:copper resistance CopC/CopD family protein n=1 Tax=Microlunatus soli TaxID=630515 RepID=UPI001560CCD3|nr:copper resistance protein CopC [Microlunatus soli]
MLRLIGPILLLAATLLVAGAAPASAHAVLVDSSPRDGARLQRLPTTITLRFDESVGATADAGRVLDADGRRVDNGTVRTTDNGRTVIIGLRGGQAEAKARYLVSWRVISADSHVVTGSLRFGVGEPAGSNGSGAANASDGPTRTGPAVIAGIGSGLGYAGLVTAIGALAVGLLIWRTALRSRWMRMLIIAGSVMIMLGAVVELAGSAVELSGGAGASPFAADDLRTVADSLPGRLLQARILASAALIPLGLGLLGSVRDHRRARGLAIGWAVLASGLLLLVAAHGHAAVGTMRVVALAATVLHLAAFCCWLGGMVVLVLMIRPRMTTPRVAGRALQLWSPFAFGCVAVLVISGELLGWRQVQPIEALWGTRYGVLLLIKLGLVALTLAAALLNRRSVTSSAGLPRAAVTFVIELSIMIGVLGVATALSSTAPAISSYGPPIVVSRPMADDRLQVRIDSTRRGPQTIAVGVSDASGRPVRLQQLTGRLSSADAGVSAIDVHFTRTRDGWRSTDAVAPLPGVWQLQVTARPRHGPSYVVAADYRVW